MKLKNLYDRRELNEIIDFLMLEGTLIYRHTATTLADFDEIDEYDAVNGNGDAIYWFINPKKRWFSIDSYRKDDV